MNDIVAPGIDLCACDEFKIWYTDDGVAVCRCGHPTMEHLGVAGPCTGAVVVLPRDEPHGMMNS